MILAACSPTRQSAVADPTISALIRCRNEERGIGRLIDALRTQTIAESIEIVVIGPITPDSSSPAITRAPMQLEIVMK